MKLLVNAESLKYMESLVYILVPMIFLLTVQTRAQVVGTGQPRSVTNFDRVLLMK